MTTRSLLTKNRATQIAIGRFHHFHLARELESHGMLQAIWSGYPRFRLRDERGVPPLKIKSFPWLHAPFMARHLLALEHCPWLSRQWAWWANDLLDRRVAASLTFPHVLIALSGSGLHAGTRMQRLGGRYICDRGSTHIRVQNQLLHQEYARWGLGFDGIDPRSLKKEEAEYFTCDAITVPSEFARQSFLEQGIAAEKVFKIPYGARLERFRQTGEPPKHRFCLLWVGNVTIQKAFLDALQAFRLLDHPQKEFCVIGRIDPCLRKLLTATCLKDVRFISHVANRHLPNYYSSSHALVLPSVQEGLANVLGEALACGCPIVASENSGASDLITDGEQGFIVPIRSPESIAEKLQLLATSRHLREQMSQAALARVRAIGGWSRYGEQYAQLVRELCSHDRSPVA